MKYVFCVQDLKENHLQLYQELLMELISKLL